jgi:hypothetical protein
MDLQDANECDKDGVRFHKVFQNHDPFLHDIDNGHAHLIHLAKGDIGEQMKPRPLADTCGGQGTRC